MRDKVSQCKMNQKAASAKHGTVKNLACRKIERKEKQKQKKKMLRKPECCWMPGINHGGVPSQKVVK